MWWNILRHALFLHALLMTIVLFLVFNRLDTTISGASKQEGSEGGRLFKMLAKSFSKRYCFTKILYLHRVV